MSENKTVVFYKPYVIVPNELSRLEKIDPAIFGIGRIQKDPWQFESAKTIKPTMAFFY